MSFIVCICMVLFHFHTKKWLQFINWFWWTFS